MRSPHASHALTATQSGTAVGAEQLGHVCTAKRSVSWDSGASMMEAILFPSDLSRQTLREIVSAGSRGRRPRYDRSMRTSRCAGCGDLLGESASVCPRCGRLAHSNPQPFSNVKAWQIVAVAAALVATCAIGAQITSRWQDEATNAQVAANNEAFNQRERARLAVVRAAEDAADAARVALDAQLDAAVQADIAELRALKPAERMKRLREACATECTSDYVDRFVNAAATPQEKSTLQGVADAAEAKRIIAKNAPDDAEFRTACKMRILGGLKNPRGARFEDDGFFGGGRVNVSRRSDGHLTLVSWVESTNSFNAVVRTAYSCVYDQQSGNVGVMLDE